MPYIGKAPSVQNIIKLDNLTASATASYTMQRDGANYSPQNINSVLVSLNGIIQSPGSSFTISGSTISFASTLSSSDSIDFILVYGDVLDTGTPSDSSVTNAKLNTAPTLISKGGGGASGSIQLNCENNTHGVKIKGPPHSASQSYVLTLPSTAPSANKALITDGSGNLSFGDAGGGKVLQAQSGALTTHISTTSTSYVAVTNCSITFSSLASTSSKVLLLGQIGTSGNHDTGHMPVRFARSVGGASYSAVGVGTGGATYNYTSATYSTNGAYYDAYPLMFLDSPSTTSATIYRMEFRSSNGATQYINRRNDDTHFCGLTTIIGLEIGA